MKKCKFCNRVVSDAENSCPACGANQFIYICENCKNEFDNGLHCPRCGVKVGQKPSECPKCGNLYYTNACPNCGYKATDADRGPQVVYVNPGFPAAGNTQSSPVNYGPKKSKAVAFLLCLFLGFYGIHKFYLGKTGMGVLYFFTAGLFFIGWIVDIFVIAFTPSSRFG